MARYLLGMDATVTVTHSKTPRSDLYAALKTADIVVGAAGLKSPLYPDLHSDAVVIDYGIRSGAGGSCTGISQTPREATASTRQRCPAVWA